MLSREELCGTKSVCSRTVIIQTASPLPPAECAVAHVAAASSVLARFAGTEEAAATYTTAHSAGDEGLAVCISQCENKRSLFRRAPHEGARHLPCVLAVASCDK